MQSVVKAAGTGEQDNGAHEARGALMDGKLGLGREGLIPKAGGKVDGGIRCGDCMLHHGIRPPDHGVCRACGSPANAVHPTRHAYHRGGMYIHSGQET
jgi:hypothetical protein